MPITDKFHKPGNNELGLCPHCGRPVHEVVLWEPAYVDKVGKVFYRHNPIPRTRVIADRERTHCSKCNKPGEWYTFKPGSGECVRCQS